MTSQESITKNWRTYPNLWIFFVTLFLMPALCLAGEINPDGFNWERPHILTDQDGNEVQVMFSSKLAFTTDGRLHFRVAAEENENTNPVKINSSFHFKKFPDPAPKTEYYLTTHAYHSKVFPVLLGMAYSLLSSKQGSFKKCNISGEERVNASQIKLHCSPGLNSIDTSWTSTGDQQPIPGLTVNITIAKEPSTAATANFYDLIKFELSYLKNDQPVLQTYTLRKSPLLKHLNDEAEDFAATYFQRTENTKETTDHHDSQPLTDITPPFKSPLPINPSMTPEDALTALGESTHHTQHYIDKEKQLRALDTSSSTSPGTGRDASTGEVPPRQSETQTGTITNRESVMFERQRTTDLKVHTLNTVNKSSDPAADEIKKAAFSGNAKTRLGQLFEETPVVGFALGGDREAREKLDALNKKGGICTLGTLTQRGTLEAEAGGVSGVSKHRDNKTMIRSPGNITGLESIKGDGTQLITRQGYTKDGQGQRVSAFDAMAADTREHSWKDSLPPGERKGVSVTFAIDGHLMPALKEALSNPAAIREARLRALQTTQTPTATKVTAAASSTHKQEPGSIADQIIATRNKIGNLYRLKNPSIAEKKRLKELESKLTRLRKKRNN